MNGWEVAPPLSWLQWVLFFARFWPTKSIHSQYLLKVTIKRFWISCRYFPTITTTNYLKMPLFQLFLGSATFVDHRTWYIWGTGVWILVVLHLWDCIPWNLSADIFGFPSHLEPSWFCPIDGVDCGLLFPEYIPPIWKVVRSYLLNSHENNLLQHYSCCIKDTGGRDCMMTVCAMVYSV